MAKGRRQMYRSAAERVVGDLSRVPYTPENIAKVTPMYNKLHHQIKRRAAMIVDRDHDWYRLLALSGIETSGERGLDPSIG